MAHYDFWLADETGRRIRLIDDFLKLTASRVLGDRSPVVLTLKPTAALDDYKADYQIQVVRKLPDGKADLFDVYLVRYTALEYAGSDEFAIVRGFCGKELLRRRIVAYYAGSSQSSKSDYADDMMKEIIDENFVSPTDTARDLSAYISIDPDLGAGPSMDKGIAWRNVLEVLKEIQETTRTNGNEVFFEMIPRYSGSSVSWVFTTYTGQVGRDRTSRPGMIVFDHENGTVVNPFYERDRREESNYIYALGQGEGPEREVQETTKTAYIAASRINRCEAARDARHLESADSVLAAGRAAAEEKRPVERYGGRIREGRNARFGIDWDYGDLVVARYRGDYFNTIVRAVQIEARPEVGAHVSAWLRYEGAINA
jgi:hypothetical protein